MIRLLLLITTFVMMLFAQIASAQNYQKHRLIVLTDIEADPFSQLTP